MARNGRVVQRAQAIARWLFEICSGLKQDCDHFNRPEDCSNIERVIAHDPFVDIRPCRKETADQGHISRLDRVGEFTRPRRGV